MRTWVAGLLGSLAMAACAVGCSAAEQPLLEESFELAPGGERARESAADEADAGAPSEVATPEEEPREGDELRIMAYNIKYGAEAGLDLSKLADAIRPSRPDVLGLQEVDEGTRRSGRRKETEELSALTEMPHHYFGKNFDYDGGAYGLSILSRYPLENPRVIRLDTFLTSPKSGHEPRIAVAADVNVRGTKFTFVNVHASLHAAEHATNGAAILAALGDGASRAIVVGDFNENPGGDLGKALRREGFVDTYAERHPSGRGFTIPAKNPTRRIDFIFRGEAFGKTTHAWVPAFTASDHRPVAATIPVP